MTSAVKDEILETWETLCRDPHLRGIPYKVETDEFGRVLMSPTKNYHAFFASRINRLLEKLLANGETANELAVRTPKGVKVPDAAWVSNVRRDIIFGESAASVAPEICVEIISDSNTEQAIAEKRQLYFAAGAREVWICQPNGQMQFFTVAGQRPQSEVCPGFPSSVGKG